MRVNRRLRAFSMVEIITGLIVIALIFSTMTMKPGSSRTGIRREAERLAAYINSLTQTADRYRSPFIMDFAGGKCHAAYGDKTLNDRNENVFKHNERYKFESNVDKFNYSIRYNVFTQGGTITVMDMLSDDINDRSVYYVIIATRGGRVRTSPDPPENWEVAKDNYTY